MALLTRVVIISTLLIRSITAIATVNTTMRARDDGPPGLANNAFSTNVTQTKGVMEKVGSSGKVTVHTNIRLTDEVLPHIGKSVAPNITVLQSNVAVTQCSIKVLSSSAQYIAREILKHKYNFAHLELRINNRTYVYMSTANVLQPGYWVWTYNSSISPFAYLSWPPEFPVLSLGLLDEHTFRGYINLSINPIDCPLTQGDPESDKLIAGAISKMMLKYLLAKNPDYSLLVPTNDDYKASSFCYLSTVAGLNQTLWYHVGVYMGLYVRGVKYTCCQLLEVKHSVNRSLQCNKEPAMWTECTDVTFVVAFVCFAFFPLKLVHIASRVAEQSRRCDNVRSFSLRSKNYEQLSSSQDSDDEYITMDGLSPITVANLVCGLCGLSALLPDIASRFRRILCVAVCPILVYINIAVLGLFPGQRKLAVEKVAHGVPISLQSLVADYDHNKHTFMPILGGPCIFLALYHLTGLLLVVLPRDLGFILAAGVSEQNGIATSPLTLDADTLEALSLVPYVDSTGYSKVFGAMWAQVYAILNPRFWTLAIRLQLQRGRVLFRGRCTRVTRRAVPRCLWYIASSIVGVLYVIGCILELTVCVVYYGIPLFSFITIAVKGFKRVNIDALLSRNDTADSNGETETSGTCKPLLIRGGTIVSVICLTIMLFFFAICLFIVLQFSFDYMTVTVVYIFLSALIYPGHSIGYIFFTLTLLYYIWKVLTDVGTGYLHLLSDIIEVCHELSPHTVYQDCVDNTLIVSNIQTNGLRLFRLNNIDIVLTDEQIRKLSMECSTRPVTTQYVHHPHNRPMVLKQLFHYVVRKHRPVHIQIFLALMQITLIAVLICFSAKILSHFSTTSEMHIDGVMQVLTLAVVGFLPKLVSVVFFHVDEHIHHIDVRRQIKHTVARYVGRHELATPSSFLGMEQELEDVESIQ